MLVANLAHGVLAAVVFPPPNSVVIFRRVRPALFPVMYLHLLTGGDDSGLAAPTCAPCSTVVKRVCKLYAHTHTRARMVLLTPASDTPRLGDTGRYGNITLVDSQVSQFPLGGSRAVDEV